MTLATYTTPRAATSPFLRKRHVTGTRHDGPAWTAAVRVLRAAVANAVEHARARRSVTSNSVGDDVIDSIAQLDAKSLHVLAVVSGMLVRASKQLDQ